MRKIFILISVIFAVMNLTSAQNNINQAPEGYNLLRENIPHGKIDTLTYELETIGTERRVVIFTSPGYDNDLNRRYPVLYLQHGWGENEYGWPNQGKVNLIMDNLIAEDLISRLTIDEKAALMCDVSEQLPDFEDYSMKGRTYKFMDDALFPFGYGLSYTTFSISEAALNKTSLKENDTLELLIPVSNTGKADGIEIVQVYIRKVRDTDGPLRTLRGFKKVSVSAGESTEAVVNLPHKSFEFFNRILKETTVPAGD